MDDQQANRDLGWLAGILDGEGSIILGLQKRKNNQNQYYHRICFYNSDDEIINKVVRILDSNEVKCYVSERQFYGNLSKKKGFTVLVSSYKDTLKLLDLIKEDLVCKKARAELLTRFCNVRLKHINKPPTDEEADIFASWNKTKTKLS